MSDAALSNTAKCERAARDMEPQFWLSPAQMLHLAFYSHLQQHDQRSLRPELLLIRYRSGLRDLMNKLDAAPPTLDGAPGTGERHAAAQRWIDERFNVQARDDSPRIGLGELPAVVVRTLLGSDGSALTAADINYQILEAALAYYAIHLDQPPRILDLLRSAGLLGGEQPHPFLHALGLEQNPDQFHSILSFYRAYLRARIRFLEQQRERLEQAPRDMLPDPSDPQSNRTAVGRPPRWLRLRQHSSLDNWLLGFKDQHGELLPEPRALSVPANLFYRPILAATARALGTTPDRLLEQGSRDTVRNDKIVRIPPAITWFLQRYLEKDEDAAQEMYRYPRGHDLFDTCLDERTKTHKPKVAHYMSEEQRIEALQNIRNRPAQDRGPAWNSIDNEKLKKLREAYRRRERRIRHLSTQDMALFLLGRDLFLEQVDLPDDSSRPTWRLDDLRNTLLRTSIDITLGVPGSDRGLRHPECKISNLGELGLLVRDRRLYSLLRYYPSTEQAINQAEVRAELTSYRSERVRMIAMVHRLEEAIYQANGCVAADPLPDDAKAIFGERDNKHGAMLYLLRQRWSQASGAIDPGADDPFGDNSFLRARLIRNAVAHNEYRTVAARDRRVGAHLEPTRLHDLRRERRRHRALARRPAEKPHLLPATRQSAPLHPRCHAGCLLPQPCRPAPADDHPRRVVRLCRLRDGALPQVRRHRSRNRRAHRADQAGAHRQAARALQQPQRIAPGSVTGTLSSNAQHRMKAHANLQQRQPSRHRVHSSAGCADTTGRRVRPAVTMKQSLQLAVWHLAMTVTMQLTLHVPGRHWAMTVSADQQRALGSLETVWSNSSGHGIDS